MEYIKTYEGFGNFFNREYTIRDMYIRNPRMPKKYEGHPDLSEYLIGVDMSVNKINFDSIKNQEILGIKKGIFGKNYGYSRNTKVNFGQYNRDNEYIYQTHSIFEKLYEIGDSLQFKSNKTIFVKPLNKQLKIIDIHKGCFFNSNRDVIFTLFYKLEGSNRLFHANQLEFIENIKDTNVIDEVIEDIFIEFIDNRTISFMSEKMYRDISYKSVRISRTDSPLQLFHRCVINIKSFDIETLKEITSRLSVASKRLKVSNMDMKITKLDKNQIEFEVHNL